MLLYKWCQLLTRTMSPLTVGLIWCCIIVVSSISHHSQTLSTHPPTTAFFKLRNHTSHSPFAKDNVLQRTKPSTIVPRVRVPITSRPIVNNGSRKDIGTTRRRMPKLHLNTKLKVTNAGEANSTVIYLPRLSRAMANFSKNSANNDMQPIIVSRHRKILLDPKEYKIRRASDTRPSIKYSNSSQFGLKMKQKASQNSTRSSSRRLNSKFSASPITNIRTTPMPNIQRIFNPVYSKGPLISESTVLVNIKSNANSTNTKNSAVFQFLPINRSKSDSNRIFPKVNRRRGRNFDLSNSNEGQEISSDESPALPVYNKVTTESSSEDNTEIRRKLLSSRFFPYFKNFSSQEHFPSSTEIYDEITLSDLGYSYTEKKAKNLTIYEILKPRLKNSTNITDLLEFSPDQNSYSLQNDAVYHQINDIPESQSANISSNIVDSEESNSTFVTNEIKSGIFKGESSVIFLPGRSDSMFGIKYVMVNRSHLTTEPPTEATPAETVTFKISEWPKVNHSHTTPSYIREDSTSSSTVTDDVQEQEVAEVSPEQNQHEDSSNATAHTAGENLSADGSEYMTHLYDSDANRQAKMTEHINNDNTPFKRPKIDSKMFYDYFAKRPIGNMTYRDFPYVEYRPGNMFRYSDIYQRKPILDIAYTRPPRVVTTTARTTPELVTVETELNPTTFNSLRSSVRVQSTYYPNRMQDVTMKFGNRIETTALPNASDERSPQYRSEDDPDDAEYRDAVDPGFTMEKLAYLLIGTCCGLSILCLFVVVVAIKCRRAVVERRIKAQFRKRMYQHERMKDAAAPWQQQMFDHFMYLHRRPGDSSCSSNTDSCNCRCVTWSLGARNLDAGRPLCPPPTSRSSLYLYGQKKLPFGAASTLRFESMLGRKRSTPDPNKTDSPHHTDSSHENDSLDLDSDSREGDGPKRCTCIDYNNAWPMMPPTHVPRGFYTLCPASAGRYNVGNCSQHAPVDLRTLAKDLPPPVTGSNYLDRSEGVVYWSSNDERLI